MNKWENETIASGHVIALHVLIHLTEGYQKELGDFAEFSFCKVQYSPGRLWKIIKFEGNFSNKIKSVKTTE